MVNLRDIFDVELLADHIKSGLITSRQHDELPFAVLNYTPECQWLRKWDDITMQCRGLVYDVRSDRVISRPFAKFFNWDESNSPYPPSGPVIRMPKMDGSLGILVAAEYEHGSPTAEVISTRGSMNSEQAKWATKFYHAGVADQLNNATAPGQWFIPLEDKTYLFEIIYPSNRIVVDYGEYEGLVLIDVIDNATGLADTDEYDNCMWPDKAPRIPMREFDATHTHDIPKGDEGFVYLWPIRNFRTKMKSADYVALHRIISNLNEKTIWQQMVDGKSGLDIKKDLPEEFHKFVDETVQSVTSDAINLFDSIFVEWQNIMSKFNDNVHEARAARADFARLAVKSKHKAFLFNMLDSKDVYTLVLRSCKPIRQTTLGDFDDE